ncbi:MAG: AIPR family protein [Prochloraceae cyanobacterium]|nr:AIPR family protein [Prochloraceae cyanobacterium]
MSENTYNWIKEEVENIAKERSVETHRAFAAWCLDFVHQDLDIDEAFVQTDTLKGYGGGDGGLDGWYKNEDTKEFHLWQCKWSESYGKRFAKTPALELKNALEELLDLERAKEYGDKFKEIYIKLQSAIEHEYQVVLNVGLAGSMSKTSITQFNKTIQSFAEDKNLRLVWERWDLTKFQQEREESDITSDTLEGQSYDFELQSPEIIHMDSEDRTLPEGWEVVVASINGNSLGTIANDLGSKLFGLNVRFALSANNKRIKSIRESLVDKEDSQYFWLYNNGLTILCDSFEIKKDTNNQPSEIGIENPQVVNGCQTVTAFKKKLGDYTDLPSVLARIIMPPSNDEGQGKAVLIAEKTNSQNPVLSRDLRSNDKVQKKLQQKFDQLNPPWFYERKRGEWKTLSPSERNKYKSKDNKNYRKYDMEYVGQAWRMLDGQPSLAITKKRELFENEEIYSKVFSSNRQAEQFLFAARLTDKYAKFWHGNNFECIRSTCGDYLTDTILKRIMNAKKQVVAHSVALTCRALKKGNNWELTDAKLGLDLIDNFEEQFSSWNNLLATAFHKLLEDLDKDEDSFGLKRTLEKSGGETLERLWSSIQSTFSVAASLSKKKKSLRDFLIGDIE